MDELYLCLILIALTTATFAMTLTKAQITEPLRVWVENRSHTLGHLIRCPYCTSHWIAFLLIWATGSSPLTFFFWIQVGAVIAVSTLVCALMLRGLFMHEAEVYKLREQLKNTRDTLKGVMGLDQL